MFQFHRRFTRRATLPQTRRYLTLTVFFILATLVLNACQPTFSFQATPTADTLNQTDDQTIPDNAVPTLPPVNAAVANAEQPTLIKGAFEYTNDFIFTYYVENAVALIDMYGFVTRNHDWELPVTSQVLGFLDVDETAQRGSYLINLPIQPVGTFADVDNDNQTDIGVQIFAVSYWPNETGGPFAEGDDRSRGWPAYLTSTVNDTENNEEVVGGKLVVWSPDDQQQFPTGFGPDRLLFTADDPVGPVPAGYTIVDLDAEPFGLSREREPSLTLYEPTDVAIKDFSALSYSEAFTQMFERVRQEYAFSGIEGKSPEWNSLYAQLAPRVAEAERSNSAGAFYLALRDFSLAFQDGHVNLSGGDFDIQFFQQEFSGGYGMAVRELDDGRTIVNYVLTNGPAYQAGIEVGAEVFTFNGQAMSDAISAVQPFGGPFSTDFGLRYEQQIYLMRAPVGKEATITFANPDEAQSRATLTAIVENESLFVNSFYRQFDPVALPVEFELLESNIGYISINTYYDDLNLMIRLFERALETFKQLEVRGIIIDLRQNGGGAPISLANYLTDVEIPLGQREYFSGATGRFEPDGPPNKAEPAERRYSFSRMALLVGPACASACDVGAYGFSQIPGMIVVGQFPTAGVYAEVARGQYRLPEGISLQVPTGRSVLPDGSIFLEGQGVPPTLRVPIVEETVLTNEDVVLQAAEEAILGR
ncbi:MAG: S41 family peptidase [Chloroflexales bacterium]|nr:S41 family peptidase [Chloroflexales bacterium]